MFNTRWYYSITLAVLVLNALLLLGVLNAVFGVEVNTSLFNTGITPGHILGGLSAIIAFWVYKKYV